MENQIQFLTCGDSALTIQFGEVAEIKTNLMVRELDEVLKANPIPGIVETVPTYRSEMIHYNPLRIRYADLVRELKVAMEHVEWDALKPSNEVVVVPIFYRCPKTELDRIAEYEHMTADEVVRIHTGRYHYCFMMGVAPGTAYLSAPAGSFTIPRKATPVPKPYASSIQIWSTHTTISPFHSQSGWNFLGQVPAASYNPKRPEDPFLVHPGQWVKFREVERDEFEAIEAEFLANRYQREVITKDLSELPYQQ